MLVAASTPEMRKVILTEKFIQLLHIGDLEADEGFLMRGVGLINSWSATCLIRSLQGQRFYSQQPQPD